jgi:hypothetical protein
MNNPLDVNTGLPIFLLTNNHPEKFFEKSTYRFEPKAVTNVNKLKQIFFSPENIKYLQEMMAYEVMVTTKKYKIPYQNEQDLRMIMETIYFDKTRNIGYALNEQLAELNTYVVKFCVPLIINEINVYLNYLDDINQPRKINTLPTSTGNLRSVSGYAPQSNINENIFLPDNQIKYIFSTTGDVKEFDTPHKSILPPAILSNNPANIYAPSPSTAQFAKMTPSGSFYPSTLLFPDDPYYLRNSLLSPNSIKPRISNNMYPTDKNGLFAQAGGSDFFLANNNNYKYANADIVSENNTYTELAAEQAATAKTNQANQANGPVYKRK